MPQTALFKHVALPLAGAAHGVQDAPQLLALSLATHEFPHRCVPAGQTCPQNPLPQVANPPAGAAQVVQELPQALASSLRTQVSPQR